MFASNIGTSLHVMANHLSLSGSVIFSNNSADNGAGLYIDQQTVVSIADGGLLFGLQTIQWKLMGELFLWT